MSILTMKHVFSGLQGHPYDCFQWDLIYTYLYIYTCMFVSYRCCILSVVYVVTCTCTLHHSGEFGQLMGVAHIRMHFRQS